MSCFWCKAYICICVNYIDNRVYNLLSLAKSEDWLCYVYAAADSIALCAALGRYRLALGRYRLALGRYHLAQQEQSIIIRFCFLEAIIVSLCFHYILVPIRTPLM